MSQEQLEALRAATAENEELRSKLATAATPEEVVVVASGFGFDIVVEDLPDAAGSRELSDAELAGVSGGYTFPATDWIYCDNPWTNVYCTLKC
ncbi:MAG: Nif11-like leader peptide family natural product [Actinomycetota bacterium]|nr:Nif11-like leader peptide family natural product [Actinomycetota bacterium]HQZ86582.1 Nif11-like leader peptide family natural product precursor [Actinomycetota bacterium]